MVAGLAIVLLLANAARVPSTYDDIALEPPGTIAGEPKPAPGSAGPAALTGQRQYQRVREARAEKAAAIKQLFAQARVKYPPHRLFIRIFKDEDEVQLWAQPQPDEPFVHLKNYAICSKSGGLGPKRRQGDLQVPEGFYQISHFNPFSNFHLSLGLNYPNAADRILGDRKHPGQAIYLHGACVTIGCIPIRDEWIKELYVIALDSNRREAPVAVHVFPMRMNGQNQPRLAELAQDDKTLQNFWANLREGYVWFEEKHTLPKVTVTGKGKYLFR